MDDYPSVNQYTGPSYYRDVRADVQPLGLVHDTAARPGAWQVPLPPCAYPLAFPYPAAAVAAAAAPCYSRVQQADVYDMGSPPQYGDVRAPTQWDVGGYAASARRNTSVETAHALTQLLESLRRSLEERAVHAERDADAGRPRRDRDRSRDHVISVHGDGQDLRQRHAHAAAAAAASAVALTSSSSSISSLSLAMYSPPRWGDTLATADDACPPVADAGACASPAIKDPSSAPRATPTLPLPMYGSARLRNVVLDIDGTLIASRRVSDVHVAGERPPCVFVVNEHMVCVRPGAREFLRRCFAAFDTVSFWTAAERCWADAVLPLLLSSSSQPTDPNAPQPQPQPTFVRSRGDCSPASCTKRIAELWDGPDGTQGPFRADDTLHVDDNYAACAADSTDNLVLVPAYTWRSGHAWPALDDGADAHTLRRLGDYLLRVRDMGCDVRTVRTRFTWCKDPTSTPTPAPTTSPSHDPGTNPDHDPNTTPTPTPTPTPTLSPDRNCYDAYDDVACVVARPSVMQ